MGRFYHHRVTRNAAALGVVQLANYVAPFVVLKHLTGTFSVATYGVVAFAVSIVQVGSVVLDVGFTLAATQRISLAREKKDFIAGLAGAVTVLKLVAFGIGGVVIVAYALATTKHSAHSALIVLTLVPLLGHALQPIWFFAGIERMGYVTMFLVTAKLVFVALVFGLVSTEQDYQRVILADGLAQLGAAAVATRLLYRTGYRIGRPRARTLRYAARMTVGFFVSRLAVTTYSSSGVLLLGLTAPAPVVAVFAFAEQLFRAVQSLFGTVVQALYPYMSKERDLRLLCRVAIGFFALAVLGAVVGHFVGPWLITAVFGSKWNGVGPILDIFLVAIPVNVLAVLAGYPLAAAVGRVDVANRSVVYGSLLYVTMAAAALWLGHTSPTNLVWLMIVADLYVLIHRLYALGPYARQEMARVTAGKPPRSTTAQL